MKIIPYVKQNTWTVKKTSAEIITFFCRGKEKMHFHSAKQKKHNKSLLLYKKVHAHAHVYIENSLLQNLQLHFSHSE